MASLQLAAWRCSYWQSLRDQRPAVFWDLWTRDPEGGLDYILRRSASGASLRNPQDGIKSGLAGTPARLWTADTVALSCTIFTAGAAAHCFLRHRLFVKPRNSKELWQLHGTAGSCRPLRSMTPTTREIAMGLARSGGRSSASHQTLHAAAEHCASMY